jgi:hypothetical protein
MKKAYGIHLVELQVLSSGGFPCHHLLPISSSLLSESLYVQLRVPYPVIKGSENKFSKEIQDNQTCPIIYVAIYYIHFNIFLKGHPF